MGVKRSSPKANFAAYIVDVLSPLGDVATRPMFGGYNVTIDGLTFALILNGVLYLKTDMENRPSFEKARLKPFSYGKGDKTIVTSYFERPDCLDDWDALESWIDGALSAARRVKAPKKKAAVKKKRAV